MPGTLVDAGPLVALLHKSDRDHNLCVDTFRQLSQPLLTTWMPVTEAMYLLGFSVDAQGALLQMIERGALEVLAVEPDDLPHIRELMHKYADLPMDFADAALVQMARKHGIDRIFTLDRRDFAVYRLLHGKTFTLIPALI